VSILTLARQENKAMIQSEKVCGGFSLELIMKEIFFQICSVKHSFSNFSVFENEGRGSFA